MKRNPRSVAGAARKRATRMTRMGVAGLLAWALAAGAGTASAATMTLSATGGASIAVTVGVTGIEALAEPSLGAYDLDLGFDDSVLSFTGIQFGSFLGGPGLSFESVAVAGGVVDFAEVSLIFPNGALQALQPDAFVLATIFFDAIVTEPTTTEVALTQAALSDGNGDPIAVAALDPLAFEAAIPEVSGIHVFAVGVLVALAGHRWRSGVGLDPRKDS